MPLVSQGSITPGTGVVTFGNPPVAPASTTTDVAPTSTAKVTPIPTPITSVNGINLGLGTGVFSGVSGASNPVLNFLSLMAGPNVVLSQNADSITISATGEISSTTSFANLTDGPGNIVANGLLFGTVVDGAPSIAFTPVPTAANQILTWTGETFAFLDPAPEQESVGSIEAGVGIAVAQDAGAYSISLTPSGITAGTYVLVTVDATGRVVAGTDASIVKSVTAGSGLEITDTDGGDDSSTDTGSITIALAANGVSAGTYAYASIIVDQYGRVSSATSNTISADPVTLTGAVSGTGTGTITTSLAAVAGLTAGTYPAPLLAVDGTGLVTAISTDPSIAHLYQFQINFDANGDVTSYADLPPNWTCSLDTQTQFTISHNLNRLPQSVACFGQNNGTFNMILPNGNIASEFGVGFISPNTQPASFTVYNVTATVVNAAVSSYMIVQVLI